MGNQNTQADPQESNPLAFIPLAVWKLAIGLILFFISLSFVAVVWFHHGSWQDFMNSGLDVFFVLLKALAALIALALVYVGYHLYHDTTMKHHERKVAHTRTLVETEKLEKIRLMNQQLRIKNEAYSQVPALMKYAMEHGHNIEYTERGELRVQNFLSNVHTLGNGQVASNLIEEATDYVPEPYKMSDVLSTWQPSKDAILLAKGRDLITVPIGEPLCHTTFTGSTDAGKTNNERFLLIQLLFLQQCIYLCDRNWQPFRVDKKLSTVYDYTPIASQLAHEPIVTTKQAVDLLVYLYGMVEDRRTERRKVQTAKALTSFDDIYLCFDELPAFAAEDKRIMELIGRLLREARQYGVFFIGAAQDLLNQTLQSDNGAVRDNLLTNYYGGGDMTTARLVLNLAKGERIDETGLGKQGVTFLRAKGAGIERVKARTPLADDLATHLLLDELPPIQQLPFTVVDSQRSFDTRSLKEQIAYPHVPVVVASTSAQQDELQQVVDAWREGYRSIGKVMEATGLGQNRSRVLIAQAKNKGLIEE